MHVLRPGLHPPSQITPREVYLGRREWLRLAAAGSVVGLAGTLVACAPKEDAPETSLGLAKLPGAVKSTLSTTEPVNAYKHVTTYNNFYEFGTDKMVKKDITEPAFYAALLAVLLGYRVLAKLAEERRGSRHPGVGHATRRPAAGLTAPDGGGTF